jgi:hypothetical protein
MSRDIDMRFFGSADSISPRSFFILLLDIISEWQQQPLKWSSFAYGLDTPYNPALTVNDLPDVSAIKECLESITIDEQTVHYSATVIIPCWRYEGGQLTQGQAIMDIKSWGHDVRVLRFGDPRLEGYASISVHPAGPYWANIDPGSDPLIARYNELVADNLDQLGQLIVLLSKGTPASSIRLFTDYGWKLPLNSHCTYFSSTQTVLDDLRFICELSVEGNERYHIPPLSVGNQDNHALALSTLRTPDQRLECMRQLRSLAIYADRADHTLVLGALDTMPLEVHRAGTGFIIFDYPYYLNSFVDSFYFEVLRNASQIR